MSESPLAADALHVWRVSEPVEGAVGAERLAAGALHVWRVDLQGIDDGLVELLSADEHERAARIVREPNRHLWMRARGVLRVLLGRYLGSEPRALRFEAGLHGKPALCDSRLAFNLSHSGPLALYALTAGTPVGVDVELDRRALDELALAARVFGEAEAQRLSKLDRPQRRREFLRAWVRHEAAVKCLGVGIAEAQDKTREALGDPQLWIAELDVGCEGAAAVATQGGPRELSLRRWG